MPVTAIDPRPALIVVDLQQGHAGARLAHPLENVVARSAELAKAYAKLARHEHSLTQVFTRIAETGTTADVLAALAGRPTTPPGATCGPVR